MRYSRQKYKSDIKKRLAYLFIFVAVITLSCTITAYVKYRGTEGRFLADTVINSVECGGLTLKEAETKIIDHWHNKNYLIKEKGRIIGYIPLNSLDFKIQKQLKKHLQINFFNFFRNYIFKSNKDINFKMIVINPETLLKYINGFDFLKRKPLHPIKNRNAYVKLLAPEFPVEREVYGNYVDPLRFFNEVVKNVEKGRFSCQYDARRFYLQPKIKSDDKKILARRKYCKKYLNKKIEYLLGEKIHVISPVTLDKIIYVRKNGKIIYRNRAINDFVESIAKRYNTLGGVHRIRPIGSRKKINVIGGNYGYMIDCRKEAMRLKKDLRSKKNIKREPIYAIRASGGSIDRDLGDKYVEINLSRQKLWLVEKGKIKLSSYVVTGNVLTGNGTPTGTYSITYMDREATLRGLNNDGTKYESRVSYWMPFNGNVGMHDAPWRGSFGGSIYRGGGSHGCVNMPPLSARTLFLKVKRGCPVVVHW